jgi:hypothetical protein
MLKKMRGGAGSAKKSISVGGASPKDMNQTPRAPVPSIGPTILSIGPQTLTAQTVVEPTSDQGSPSNRSVDSFAFAYQCKQNTPNQVPNQALNYLNYTNATYSHLVIETQNISQPNISYAQQTPFQYQTHQDPSSSVPLEQTSAPSSPLPASKKSGYFENVEALSRTLMEERSKVHQSSSSSSLKHDETIYHHNPPLQLNLKNAPIDSQFEDTKNFHLKHDDFIARDSNHTLFDHGPTSTRKNQHQHQHQQHNLESTNTITHNQVEKKETRIDTDEKLQKLKYPKLSARVSTHPHQRSTTSNGTFDGPNISLAHASIANEPTAPNLLTFFQLDQPGEYLVV